VLDWGGKKKAVSPDDKHHYSLWHENRATNTPPPQKKERPHQQKKLKGKLFIGQQKNWMRNTYRREANHITAKDYQQNQLHLAN